MRGCGPLLLVLLLAAVLADDVPLGFFLRSLPAEAPKNVSLAGASTGMSQQFSVYRVVPGLWHSKDHYHFDGLAYVMKLTFAPTGGIDVLLEAYQSRQFTEWDKCIVFGVGSIKALGDHNCFRNPVVNLLPFQNQLWLTIDTDAWGRIDPVTLDTLPGTTKVDSTILNAHPACDPATGECFAEGACGGILPTPWHRDACVFALSTTSDQLVASEVSRLRLPEETLLQHSHSLCLTPGHLLVKLDRFELKKSDAPDAAGMLNVMQQQEKNLWLLMDRRTRQSRLLESDFAFVNNHFWNCYEEAGQLVVESVTATHDYLDQYFLSRLAAPRTNWTRLFHPAKRCRVQLNASVADVACVNLMADEEAVFDYPTFNPLFKTRSYRWFYAIAPLSSASRWFDSIVKVDHRSGTVVARFAETDMYYTEADFVPGPNAAADEDAGQLVSVAYNATADRSYVLRLDAKTMQVLDRQQLPYVVPFHAHGIVCMLTGKCFSNP